MKTSNSHINQPFRVSTRNGLHQWTIVLGVSLLSLGISLWQLSVPEQLSLYNSGVYFAASFKLVNGVMPYRDFAFVQPPGIMLLLSPATLVARLVGTHDGFIMARVMSGVVTGANAGLLALLVRNRGRVAMLIAGGGLALLPVSSWVSSEVMLEPYCLFFSLLGVLVVLATRHAVLTSRFALILGGVLLGIAGLVKLWALFPIIALAICLWPSYRRRAFVPLVSAAMTFVAVSLPFFASSPRRFISQVVVQQLLRGSNHTNDVTILNRLVNFTGFVTTRLVPSTGETLIAFAVLTGIVIIAFRRDLFESTPDLFLLVATIVTITGLLIAPEFYSYYAYFVSPFLLGLFAVTLARLAPLWHRIADAVHVRKQVRDLVRITGGLAGVLLLFGMVLWVTSQYSAYLFGYGVYTPWLDAIDHHIPKGACVVYSDVAFGVLTNRLATNDPHCPNVVDPDGMLIASSVHGVAPAALVNEWRTDFNDSQYVVLLYPRVPRIPWNQSLDRWFSSHYHLVYAKHFTYIYENKSLAIQ